MTTFFERWFDDLYAVEYVDDIVDRPHTAFRFPFQFAGFSLQGFPYRHNYPCQSIPAGKSLQALVAAVAAEEAEGRCLDFCRGLGHLRLTPPRAFSCPNALKDCSSESNTPQYATPSFAGFSLQG